MKKLIPVYAAAIVAVALSGCFDNRARPADVTPVTSLKALAATNRADVVRLYLRGGAEPLAAGALKDLPKLRELDLSERKLSAVPDEVFALPELAHFWFVRNALKIVPEALLKNQKLAYLNLDGNPIAELPGSVGGAASLRWLHLDGCQLKDLPGSLGTLPRLERLYARSNRFDKVPAALEKAAALTDVALDGNGIVEIPGWFVKLPNLRHVSFAKCPITRLPEDISAWRRLDALVLTGCPIKADEMARIRKAVGDGVAVTF